MECMEDSEKRRSADSLWLETIVRAVFRTSSCSAGTWPPPPMKPSSRQESRLYQGLLLCCCCS